MLNDEEKRFYVTYIFIGGLLVNWILIYTVLDWFVVGVWIAAES